MVDYFVNGIPFSAKSAEGAAPSGSTLFSSAYQDMLDYPDKYTQ